MATFKCKMCGGALELNGSETVVTCEYCGTQQTLPKLDDDRRANLYDRANHFRRNNEFDKATGIYEQILNEDNTDAEAYWSLVLCRYGIEYVEDPASRKRVPTVNRAQFTSVFDDDNYKSALQYADISQRTVYEAEAKAINEIQKGILAISQKEEPFDVFICYKETDNNGRRTPDSVLANDLYHQLIQEGFKVFFARITLEDKLGQEYEPYIFAALNSSKIMVALGTKPEYFKAVWVRNEWSRFLSLIKQGEKKMLIPAYKDMDPYDLPDEFSHLQAQDMSKLGFMQDLIRGIKKILQTDEPKATVVKETVITAGNANAASLLKRAFIFLEDGDWTSADEYCEKVLDIDPENAEAYLGKLMAELRVKHREALKDQNEHFNSKNNFQKALRYGDDELQKELQGYVSFITNRKLTTAYNSAVRAMESATTESGYKRAAQSFAAISNFKDAQKLSRECLEKAEEARLNALYTDAKRAMESATTEAEYRKAMCLFEEIAKYQDSASLAAECREKAEDTRKDAILVRARAQMTGEDPGTYAQAIQLFKTIPGWRDADAEILACEQKIEEIKAKAKDAILDKGKNLMHKQVAMISDFEKAIQEFQKIPGWKDADDMIFACEQRIGALKVEQEAERLERERREELARKKAKRNRKIALIIVAVVCALALVVYFWLLPFLQFKGAVEMIEGENYDQAEASLVEIYGFGQSEQYLALIHGIEIILSENYNEGIGEILSAGFPVTVTYNTDGGTVPQNSVTYNTAGEFQGFYDAEKEGYRFVEWTNPVVSYEDEMPLSLTLTAVWSDEFLIDYELDGGTGKNPSKYRNDGKAIQLEAPTKTGYTFVGWTGTNLDTPTIDYTIPAGTYGNLAFTANWNANTYTITFELNGGKMDAKTAMDVTYDSPFTLPTPTREGYTFGGWYFKTTAYSSSGTWGKTGNTTLSAKWNAIQYKITYNLDGGKNTSQNPASYTAQSKTITLQSPTKNGYKFLGWYSDSSFNNKVTKIDPAGCKDIALYAKWELGTYTIKYDAKGGTISGTPKTSFTIKDLPLSLPNVTRAGCTFLGWYNGSTKVKNWNSAADVTLTAKWDPIKYKITYNLNGGKNASDNPATYHVDSGTVTLKAPTKNGYKFLGWYSDSAFNNKVTQLNGKDAKDITLYAKWEIITYTITYNLNGGTLSGTAKKTFTVNDLPLTLPGASKSSMAFIGWNYGSANGKVTEKVTTCENVTLYASFMDPNLKLTLSRDGKYYTVSGYSGTATHLEIPAYYKNIPVTIIGNSAFGGSFSSSVPTLTSVTLPNTITTIGEDAFQYSKITSIVIPNSVTSIGEWAFYSCENLKSVTFSTALKSIGDVAFAHCDSLTSVVLPDSLTQLGGQAFTGCSALKTVVLSKKLTEIEHNTFSDCTNLTSITLHEGITNIGWQAFEACRSLTKLIIPASVTSVDSGAFTGCSKLSFYCRTSIIPDGWDGGWNNNRPVTWGYTGN